MPLKFFLWERIFLFFNGSVPVAPLAPLELDFFVCMSDVCECNKPEILKLIFSLKHDGKGKLFIYKTKTSP